MACSFIMQAVSITLPLFPTSQSLGELSGDLTGAEVCVGTKVAVAPITVGKVPGKLATFGNGDYKPSIAVQAEAPSNLALTLLNKGIGGANPVGIRFANAFTATEFNQIAGITALPEQSWTKTNSTRNGALSFTVNSNGNPKEKMRISSKGNIGIGTTSPDYRLEVLATSTVAQDLVVRGSSSDPGIGIVNTAPGGRAYSLGSTGGTSGAGQGKGLGHSFANTYIQPHLLLTQS